MEFEAQNKQNKIKINFTEIRLVRENGRGVGETAEGGQLYGDGWQID